MSGADYLYEAYITLEGFVNPSTVRILEFTCEDEITGKLIAGKYEAIRGDIKGTINS